MNNLIGQYCFNETTKTEHKFVGLWVSARIFHESNLSNQKCPSHIRCRLQAQFGLNLVLYLAREPMKPADGLCCSDFRLGTVYSPD